MTYADLPTMPTGEWRTLATEVSDRLVAALDLDDVPLPRGVAAFAKLPKGFTLARTASGVPEMGLMVSTLAVYGQTARAGRGVREFQAFPFGTARFPEPSSWQIAIHTVWYFAGRTGDLGTVAELDQLTELFPLSDLPAAYLDGRILRNPLDLPAEVQEKRPTRNRASSYLMQLSTLASMWVYGGSDAYPRSRIEAEVERYLTSLFALPDCAPSVGQNSS